MNSFDASPTKDFFINMLTRDIPLDRAILDLVDNSIDGARNEMIRKNERRKEMELFNGYRVQINVSSNSFEIKDNCGGFSIKDAREYAFRTGKPDLKSESKFQSIGRFGIGMKRALFKMGERFWVESKSNEDHFIVNQNVTEWKNSPETREVIDKNGSKSIVNVPWKFDFIDVNDGSENKRVLKKAVMKTDGTYIKVTSLYGNIKRDFEIENFKKRLKDTLERTYNYCIHKGLEITLNGKRLKAEPIELLYQEGNLEPFFQEYDSKGVKVKIYAGVGEPDPNKAGWYIFCNDRLMVEKERTNLTGWEGGGKFFNDTGVQKYHNKVAMFRGLVFMYSNDAAKLPMTTTKTGIDFNSSIYTEVRSNMVEAMKNVLADIRKISSAEQRSTVVQKTTKVDVLSIKKGSLSNNFNFKIWDSIYKVQETVNVTKITYSVNTELFSTVKKHLKVRTIREVGEKTFEYYVLLNELN